MNKQTQALYQLAQDSILIRGMLAPNLAGNLTVEIEVHLAWSFPTSGQDKIIELKAELESTNEAFGFPANPLGNPITQTVRTLDEFDQLVTKGWKEDWQTKVEWSNPNRVVVMACSLLDGSDVRAANQSTIAFVMPMCIFTAIIETAGHERLGLPEDAWNVLLRCLHRFLAKNVKKVFQVMSVL